MVELFSKIEALRDDYVPTERLRGKSGTFQRWDDVEDLWDDAEVSAPDGTKLEIEAAEEVPEENPEKDPTLLFSPKLTRKRKGETSRSSDPTMGKGDQESKKSKSRKSHVETTEGSNPKENPISSSSGMTGKRKQLHRLQSEIAEMEARLPTKPSTMIFFVCSSWKIGLETRYYHHNTLLLIGVQFSMDDFFHWVLGYGSCNG